MAARVVEGLYLVLVLCLVGGSPAAQNGLTGSITL